MTKITVDKREDIASLIEKVIKTKGKKVTLIVPREAEISTIEANFKLLAREAELSDKEIAIESIDEKVLGYAHKHGLAAEHPLFQHSKEKSLTDIVADDDGDDSLKRSRKKKHNVHVVSEIVAEDEDDEDDEEEEDEIEEVEDQEQYEEEEETPVHHGSKMREEAYVSELRSGWGKRIAWAGVGVAGILMVLGIFGWSFGKVTVSLAFIKTPFDEAFTVTAEKDREVASAENDIIPAVLFTEEKNLVQTFEASGRERVARKAKAKVTIYNAFNSKPQVLVATTRLQTPDGKIFRLDEQITVPGANVEDGQIVPSSIEATATADEPGEEYNIGPISKLTIPGFKGSDRYEGFYASINERAEGGMVGEAPVPTDEDVKEAEAKTREAVLAAVSTSLSRRLPEEYTLLDDASRTTVTKLTVNTEADESGKFSVFGEAEQQVLVFRERDILFLLGEKQQAASLEKELQDVKLSYSDVVANFEDGTLTFGVSANGVLVSPFSRGELQDRLAGQSFDSLKRELASVSGVSEAKFFVYPPWIWNVPGDPNRIEVEVE